MAATERQHTIIEEFSRLDQGLSGLDLSSIGTNDGLVARSNEVVSTNAKYASF